ncbi:hypothetical protein [Nocardioides yefusunii]|uniref:ABC transporter permease n=1 Tax=Nocardioides yefusunii TaxID=2500546 RepID=A0ABW1R211_9ACTN|nr:hypothetical protein [Nocardioides yefusunii]
MTSQENVAPRADRTPPPAWVRLTGLTVALGAVLVVLLALFILPSLKSGPHDLALGVVGTTENAAALQQQLDTASPDAFDVVAVATLDELHTQVSERDLAGGLAVTDTEVTSVVASAGGTAISGTVTSTATQVARAAGLDVVVDDVVPLPAEDPSGIGIGGLAFPLVFGGIVPVVAFRTVFPRSAAGRIAGITAFSLVGGLIVSAVLQFWFGSTDGVFLQVAGAMALGIAALAFPLAGLQEVLGGKGFTIGAASMMFLGNPLAGIATTGAWLPAGIGTFGQILPPGATGSLVRSAAYFDFAGGAVAGLTLACWVIIGAGLLAVGAVRGTTTTDAGADTDADTNAAPITA